MTRADGEPPDAPTEFDLHLFGQGKHERLWDVLGAHVVRRRHRASRCGRPHARQVSVVGEFNGWDRAACPLERVDAGVWGGFVPGIGSRTPYKYAITGADGRTIDRADPMAQFAEHSGGMASIVFESQPRVAGRRVDGAAATTPTRSPTA